MEAQSQRHHHNEEEDPHHTGLHSGEGEKKSVLKKVKDKARKIKDTIKKHGHIHDHEGGHRRGGICQEGFEDDDDDDEVDTDPEAHGAPNESCTIRSSDIPRETIANSEKPTDRREDRYNHNVRDEGTTQLPSVPEHRPMEAPASHNTNTLPNVDQPNIKTGRREDDPRAPNNSPANVLPSNYQSKVTDPNGAGGKDVDPLVHQLGNRNVGNPDARGRRVQFAPEPTPMQKQINPESKPENPEMNSKGQDSGNTIAGKVYDKVAGTGSAVLSKVYGMVGAENEGARGGDRGPSMKEYLSEKFRPGDEDKALSEVITNALHKKNEPVVQEEGGKKLGKVTVSKEVAERLGSVKDSKREGEDAMAAGKESSGQGVVERLTDAVGLWLGKSEGMQTAKDSVAQSHVSDATGSGSGSGTSEVGEGKGVNVGSH